MQDGVGTPAYNADGHIRERAWVAELIGMLNLAGWPAGMRVIARKERPHPGAQLRITDADGLRVTAFAPTPPAGSSPTSSSGTAAAPEPRTASGARRTPGCATSPSCLPACSRLPARRPSQVRTCWTGAS